MNKLFALSLLCAAFMGVSAHAQTQDTSALPIDTIQYGSISGVIIDAETREPLPGVMVTVVGTTRGTYANVYGCYRVDNLPPGNYSITIRMMGFVTQTIKCIVMPKQPTYIDVKLRTMMIRGIIDHGGAYPKMIDYNNTGTVHKWTADEINKLPGH